MTRVTCPLLVNSELKFGNAKLVLFSIITGHASSGDDQQTRRLGQVPTPVIKNGGTLVPKR